MSRHIKNNPTKRPVQKIISSSADSIESTASDDYHDALMSSLVAISNQTRSSASSENEKKPTESRIEFIKAILDGSNLKPMVDFDNIDTESATNTKLNKKIMNVKELFSSMNVRLKYIKSGTTGHTFKAISKTDSKISFAVKVCAYPKDEYGGMNNAARPENVELRFIKLLTYFVARKSTPHFVLPLLNFNTSITNFIRVPKNIIDLDNEKNEIYKRFVERYYDGEFEDFVSVIVSEWCNGGDLLDYIRKNYASMTLKHWKIVIFQILFTLARIHQDYPTFRHNDMKANNILVELTNIEESSNNQKCYRYNLDKYSFYIPNINLQIKIWDFDFACVGGIIENNKVNSDWTKKMNITNKKNQYYDMHYFFNTLITKRFFPQFYEGGAPPEIIEFIHRIIPEKFRSGSKYVNKKGRIQVNTEYTTPYQVITKDPLFKKYRYTADDF